MSNGMIVRVEAPAELVLLSQAEGLQVYTSSMERRLIKAAGRSAILELTAEEQAGRVNNLLVWIFKDLDIKKGPVDYDVARFIHHLELNHPRFTTADVKGAFEMFGAARFPNLLPENHHHFQDFSVAFYSKILRAYVQTQAEARHQVRHRVQKAQLQLAAPEIPKEVTDFRSLTIIRQQVANFIENGSKRIAMVGFTHDWLVRLAICSPVEPPTNEEKVDALKRLKESRGVAVAFTWKMQRLLAGERVDDVEWEALCHKRTEAMFRDIGNKGRAAVDRIDAEIERVKERAKMAGVELNEKEAA